MRHLIHLTSALAILVVVGCPMSSTTSVRYPEPSDQAVETSVDPIEPPDQQTADKDSVASSDNRNTAAEPLAEMVSRTLKQNLSQRELASSTHGAWQVLHGILAYGSDFELQTPTGPQPALAYLLSGQTVGGFEAEQGDEFGTEKRPGLRMAMQPSTKIGQGHRDQWLAVIAQSGLPLDTPIKGKTHTFTLEDWMRQAEFDVPRNLEREFSWSLIALTSYRKTNHRWMGRDGSQYSTESLLGSELEQSLPNSVCGGTHRLIGMAMALNQRREEGQPITGVWADADMLIQGAIQLAKQNQNPDGSYSVAYLHRPGWTRDMGETLGSTGHVLEFLAIAAPTQTLSQPWVERSVRRLCNVLDQCSDV
ncbi:MAG: hypothetical protein GY924_22560, partial [Planctomycetaceae bacterium]|nr:hypothetical protein [Planctomycetaceae bacterium]